MNEDAAVEEVMKAVLALIIIYVGTFLVAIQGASKNPVQVAAQNAAPGPDAGAQAKSIDPAKEADIHALMELVGVRDAVQDAANNASEQYREKLLATVPNNDKGQAFVNAVIDKYEKKFDANQVTEQLAGIYDKHFTEDEIKGLLQFYGSPLGQKVAAEMPKVSREIQVVSRTASTKAAREALQAVKEQNPEIGEAARLGNANGQRRWQQRRPGQPNGSQQAAQQQDPK